MPYTSSSTTCSLTRSSTRPRVRRSLCVLPLRETMTQRALWYAFRSGIKGLVSPRPKFRSCLRSSHASSETSAAQSAELGWAFTSTSNSWNRWAAASGSRVRAERGRGACSSFTLRQVPAPQEARVPRRYCAGVNGLWYKKEADLVKLGITSRRGQIVIGENPFIWKCNA